MQPQQLPAVAALALRAAGPPGQCRLDSLAVAALQPQRVALGAAVAAAVAVGAAFGRQPGGGLLVEAYLGQQGLGLQAVAGSLSSQVLALMSSRQSWLLPDYW